jgi:neutral ceramidase
MSGRTVAAWLVLIILAGVAPLRADGLQAGVGRAVITPPLPAWLSGYAARSEPADEILHDLWAKALVIQDGAGGRVVFVTTDLIGLPREISQAAALKIQTYYGLKRSEVLFNSSHTHTGPAVRPNLSVIYNWGPEYEQPSRDYAEQLTTTLVHVVGQALDSLAPVRISVGRGSAGFAVNRREVRQGRMVIGVNRAGPVDHDVPVVQVTDLDGKPLVILFGYACHATTLTASTLKVSGDYAGFAQLELEQRFPGAAAMFMSLCGGDQNPEPRGSLEHAAAYGKELSQAVQKALAGRMRVIEPRIRTAFQEIELEFAEHDRETFEAELESGDQYRQRRAGLMLEGYDQGRPVRSLPYPVQAVRLDGRFVILALAGEVVVDYAIRAKREYPQLDLMVAGYSNEVTCYIPSARVLREGGYEANESMIYYGLPGPLAADVEERVFQSIHTVLRELGIEHISPARDY